MAGGTIGEQSADVYNILTSHKNVFYFSGHIHNPIDSVSVGSKDGVTFIDVPCLLSSEDTGVGYQVEYTAARRSCARGII